MLHIILCRFFIVIVPIFALFKIEIIQYYNIVLTMMITLGQ